MVVLVEMEWSLLRSSNKVKVCILNSTTNKVENIIVVDDANNVPSFAIKEGQVLATDHTGNIGDTWNGSSYDKPVFVDNRTEEQKQAVIDAENKKASAKQKLQDLGLTVDEIKEAFGI